MGKPRQGTSKATADDVNSICKTVREELQLEARFIVKLDKAGNLIGRGEVFREIAGERIGIAAYEERVFAYTGGLDGTAYRCVLKAYWEAKGLTYAKPKPTKV